MALIEFYSSTSFISGLPREAFLRLRESIFYYDGAILYKTKNYALARRYLIEMDGSFPSGLLKRVMAHLDSTRETYQVRDNRYRPRPGYIRFPQLIPEPRAYIDQQLAVDKCKADPWGHGIVVMPTGVGKSRVIKDTIQQFGVKTLVVPPSKTLKTQIHDYLTACFGSDMVEMYDKRKGCRKPVTILNIDGFGGIPPEALQGVDMVLSDEFHHSGARGYRDTNKTHWDKVFYKFGYTATNFRNDPADQVLLESVLSVELFSMTPIQAMEKKYIVPIQPIMQTVYNHEMKCISKYADAYDAFVVENLERNGHVCTFAEKMKNMRIPTLILVKRVEHGRWLQSAIQHSYFLNGQDEDSHLNMDKVEAFNRLEIPVLIGTSVIGEGVDTKSAGAVILANGEKARSRVWQNIGRVVRLFPNKSVGYVFDFADKVSKFMKNHSKERRKIYINDFGREPKLLE